MEAGGIHRLNLTGTVISGFAIVYSLFHLYTGAFGMGEAFIQRIIHFGAGSLLIFLVLPLRKKEGKRTLWFIDAAVIALVVISMSYLLWNYIYIIEERFRFVTPLLPAERILGIISILLVLEVVRRTTGLMLFSIVILFIVYTFVGQYLPGILHHAGVDLDTLVEQQYMTMEGIFGIPLAVSSTYVIMFIIFGAFLEASGFGDLLFKAATGLAGRFRGGPAKVAVLASGLMGMISGSSTANVVTTGTFTIPLMKKVGYKSYFAGAVEAAASCGGQIMPPVMGATAFVMAEYTGIPYITICKYAVLPGILYFLGIGFMVHFEAVKLGLKGISTSEEWKLDFLCKSYLLLPLIVLIYLLVKQFSPMYAVIYSIVSLIVLSQIRKVTRITFAKALSALEQGAKSVLPIMASCAGAGVIVGIVFITGLGARFSSYLVAFSAGNLYLGLFMAMVISIILGMGLPTTAAYVIQVALVVPALLKMGLPLYAAHFFVLYFSALSLITPPVAISSYAAAGIAGSPIMRTGLEASKLAAGVYLIPYMFVFSPSLFLIGNPLAVTLTVITSIIGIAIFAAGVEGYLFNRMALWERGIAVFSGILLIKPGMFTDGIGGVLIVGILFAQFWGKRKIRSHNI